MASHSSSHKDPMLGLTLPETNGVAPENHCLEYNLIFGISYFQRLCWFQGVYALVSLNKALLNPCVSAGGSLGRG